MQGQWSHGEAYYRCRFPEEYALANHVQHPRNIYLRESWVIPPLDAWVSEVFRPHRLDDTIDQMSLTTATGTEDAAAAATARRVIAECTAKLATHRTALEAGADPTVVTQWIAETQARRVKAEADLRVATHGPAARMSRNEIARIVRSISDLTTVIQKAETADKIEIYRRLGLHLIYEANRAIVRAEIRLDERNTKPPRSKSDRGDLGGVRGGT
ncbi:hypothetical protein AB0F42_06215 [Streptomyces buecherae]|uniref:hypothetical protein n=1 Tax=Streptomyces buecherae TaxID=2763006 RepID=UPI0033F407D0